MHIPLSGAQLSKTQKLRLAMIVIACGLVAYALGIITNFFASPMFSMFFIISYQTAHTVVTYTALAAAVVIGIVALRWGLLKNFKIGVSTKQDKNLRESLESSPITGKMSGQAEDKVARRESARGSFIQTKEHGASEVPSQKIENVAEVQRTSSKVKSKMTCGACKKEFITPIYMIDYAESRPKLASYCPYCNKPLQIQQDHEMISDIRAQS